MKKPVLIVVSGMPCTGKSTLAAHIAKHTGAPMFSVDPIESAILDARIARSFETGLAAYLVAGALAEARLRMGQDAIVDAVSSVAYAKRMWRRLATRHGARLRVIECVCSDEALHRRRLARRHRGLSVRFREPTWRDITERRREWVPWTEPVLVVDAVAPARDNARKALAWLAAPARTRSAKRRRM